MDHAAVVRGLDRQRDLTADVERFVHREGPFRETRREGVARDVFKNEELTLIGLFDAVNRRDIGMAQGSEELGFAVESYQAISVEGEDLGEDFDRDQTVQPRVRARYTTPMPPRPSSRSTGYDPSIDGVAIGLGAFYCAGSPDVLMDPNL